MEKDHCFFFSAPVLVYRSKSWCPHVWDHHSLGWACAKNSQAAARGAEFGSAFRLALLGMYVRDLKKQLKVVKIPMEYSANKKNLWDKKPGWVILLMAEILHHLGWCWNPINHGINFQPQLVSLPDFRDPSTVLLDTRLGVCSWKPDETQRVLPIWIQVLSLKLPLLNDEGIGTFAASCFKLI